MSRLAMDAKIWAAQERGRNKDSYKPSMPPLGSAEYLIRYFYEVGPVTQTGMGSAPLSFQEIKAWQDCTGIALSTLDARALRSLSVAYMNESNTATERGHPSPWSPDDGR